MYRINSSSKHFLVRSIELNQMEFESRMRKLITTAVEPLIQASQEEVKRRLQNESNITRLLDKVKLLEATAFKR